LSANSRIWPVYLGDDFAARARVTLLSGDYITQAALASVSRSVFHGSTTPTSGPTSLTVANVVYDTLQEWDKDATGYNFAETLDNSLFTEAGDWGVRYTFVTTGGTDSVVWFFVRVSDPRTA